MEPTPNAEIVEPRVYVVPDHNMATLQARIEKLNRRAHKLAMPEIVINTLRVEDRPHMVPAAPFDGLSFEVDPTGRLDRFHHITVIGSAPRLAGWAFIATIHPVSDEEGKWIGNEIRPVPGNTIPPEYRNADLHCDHCHSSRYRKDVFVIRHEDGRTKQIGRNCLVDFIGTANPESYAAWAEILCGLDALCSTSEECDGERHGVRTAERYSLLSVLAAAACVVRLDGWRSRKTAEEFGGESTSATVGSWLWDSGREASDRRKQEKKPIVIADEDLAMAREVADWMEALNERDLESAEEYIYNLALIGRAHVVEARQVGLTCSAISAYLREQEREINRRKRAEVHAASAYVGAPGERLHGLLLTLEFTRAFESQFGTRHLYKFVDPSGNVLVWWASDEFTVEDDQPLVHAIKVGETVLVDASVKAHEIRDEIRQTVISRVAQYFTKEQKKARKAAVAAAHIAYLTERGYCLECEGSGNDSKRANFQDWFKWDRLEAEEKAKYTADPEWNEYARCYKCRACGGSGKAEPEATGL